MVCRYAAVDQCTFMKSEAQRYYVIDDGFSVWGDYANAQSVLEAYVSRRQMSVVLGTYTRRIVVNVHVYGTEVRVWV
jgi:hypothetical protein